MMKSIFTGLLLCVFASSAAQAGPLFSASVTIPGTFVLDFETAAIGNPGDVFWNQLTVNTRQLEPRGAAGLHALGVIGDAGYAAITAADLFGYAYGPSPIVGPPGGTDLGVGGVFAVLTNEGNYGKAIVERFDTVFFNNLNDRVPEAEATLTLRFYDITIRYELFAPTTVVPVPPASALMVAGLLGLGWAARRRARSRPPVTRD